MELFSKLKSFLFENLNTRQTIAKNTFWLSVSQLGSRLIRASIVIYAARILGAAQYGVFSYALGLAGFFTVFSDVGVGQIMTRETAQRPEMRSYYFATTFWIKLFLLALSASVIVFIVPLFSKISAVDALLPFMAILVFADGLRDFCLSLFRALEKMEWEAIITIATNLLITLAGFVVLYFFATAKAFSASYALSVVAGATIAMVIIRKEFSKIFSHARVELVKSIIQSAVPIAFSSAIGVFMLNTDFIMLGWWQSAQAIGYYSAGQKIIQLLFTLPAIISGAIFPALARLIGNRDNEKVKMLVEKSLTIVFLLSLPMIVGIIVLAKPIIIFVYGQEYIPGTANFAVLALTLIFTFPGALIGVTAIALDKQKQITKYLFISSIANALFDAILIPIFGIIGSTIATIIALSINVGFSWVLIKKLTNFKIVPHLTKIASATAIMGIISFTLNKLAVNLIINIVISIMSYVAVLYLSKEKVLQEAGLIISAIKS